MRSKRLFASLLVFFEINRLANFFFADEALFVVSLDEDDSDMTLSNESEMLLHGGKVVGGQNRWYVAKPSEERSDDPLAVHSTH